MTEHLTVHGRVGYARRLPNSRSGNPQYAVTIVDGASGREMWVVRTKPDADINHGITNSTFRTRDTKFTLETTDSGVHLIYADVVTDDNT